LKVLVCDPIDREGIRKLQLEGFKVDVKYGISSDELKRIIGKYDAIIVRSRTKINGEIMRLAERLKVIGRAGSGLDNIDMKAAEEMGIAVLNTPEAPARAVAELTFGLILSLTRKIPQADHSMKEGKWLKKKFMGQQLCGKTIGLVGLGNVGLQTAYIAKGFGMKILIHKRRKPNPELLRQLGAEYVSLEELLRRSDIVSLHIPLTDETRSMIGAKELSLMKKGAFLINTSRGPIIDHEALYESLKSRKLGGAALDVYDVEPPKDLRLIKLPNVLCTPHIGAQTVEAQKEASILIAKKIIDLVKKRDVLKGNFCLN